MQRRQEEEFFGRFSFSKANIVGHDIDHPTLSSHNGTNVIYSNEFTSARPLTSVLYIRVFRCPAINLLINFNST